ncbi:pathogenicity determinant protein PdpA1, partial [Francisella tularensis subsp. holarctica]|nr:pathogenicity determinant protein PdpA1 [Francisella tularensis subsp. holarctica]
NIKPIHKNVELEDISFGSTRNKQYFKHNSLTLKNPHIEKLEVCENIYGINGWLTFDVAYINNHKDFNFLLSPIQRLLFDLQI